MKSLKRLNINNVREKVVSFSDSALLDKKSDNKIVHIGIGAFSRAHQALYTQIANENEKDCWSIVGVSIRNPYVRDNLKNQNYLYTINERSLDEDNLRLITCLENILVGSENPDDVIEQIACESTKIVTVTVTEKGYCHKNNHLDQLNSAVLSDIASGSPTTMPAYLAYALLKRRNKGAGGVTVISCDNLPNNGLILSNVVKDFARNFDKDLSDWIEENVCFCSTMVDRIVPGATDQSAQEISNKIGLYDAGALLCEPYKQWVIEDNFCSSRPSWEKAGALFVDDVTIYEKLKLRILNGCHSALAYIGLLLGDEFIHETISRPKVEIFIKRLMENEQGKSLLIPTEVNMEQYCLAIINRFKNKYVPYRNAQVATDGSLKIPQRLLYSAADLRAQGKAPRCIALSLAAWMKYLVESYVENQYSIHDANLNILVELISDNLHDDTGLVKSLLTKTDILPVELQGDTLFEALVLEQYQRLGLGDVESALVEATAL